MQRITENSTRNVNLRKVEETSIFRSTITYNHNNRRITYRVFRSIEAAPAWFEYGNALLTKEEDNPSEALLGDTAAPAASSSSSSSSSSMAPADIEVDEGEGEEQGEDEEDEEPDDLQIAWEAFEVIFIPIIILIFISSHIAL